MLEFLWGNFLKLFSLSSKPVSAISPLVAKLAYLILQ